MGQIGFDNDKYLAMQSAHIRERISKFGGKLYLEFGGKLFDDFHASRVLPGFQPDSKIRMLQQLRDDAEIVIAVNANDIEKNKVRGDLGITYDDDCLRLIDAFRSLGLYVGGVCITQYAGQNAADAFIKRLNTLGVRNYRHYPIAGYPSDVAHIVSDEGFGRNEYIETTHSLIVVTAPGPGSGKMATCLSQLYHEHKHGVSAGYAKFETFPIWNLPLKHPVNLAYEAATADLDDVNMIDPFHLEAYGETTVNYNRDVEERGEALSQKGKGSHDTAGHTQLERQERTDEEEAHQGAETVGPHLVLIMGRQAAAGSVPFEAAFQLLGQGGQDAAVIEGTGGGVSSSFSVSVKSITTSSSVWEVTLGYSSSASVDWPGA